MGRYDKYMEAVEKEKIFSKEQEKLHEKHENISDDVVIVEKSNMAKFCFKAVKLMIKTVSGIVFLILAAIGIMTMLYPQIRIEFFNVLNEILSEIKNMI